MTYGLSKKMISLFCMSFALATCGGCTHAKNTDQRQAEDTAANTPIYTISGTSQEDIDTLNNVANKAAKFCQSRGKKFEIIDRNTKYLGLTDEQKRLVHKANHEFSENNSTTSDRDYRVTIKFRCISKDAK